MVFMSRFTPFTTKCLEKPIPKEFFRCSLRAALNFRTYSLKQCRGISTLVPCWVELTSLHPEKNVYHEECKQTIAYELRAIVKSTVCLFASTTAVRFYKIPHSGYVASWIAEFTRHQAPAQLYRIVTAKFRRSLLRFKSHVKPLFVPPLLQPLTKLQPQNGSSVSVARQTGVVRPSLKTFRFLLFFVIKRKIIDEILTSF